MKKNIALFALVLTAFTITGCRTPVYHSADPRIHVEKNSERFIYVSSLNQSVTNSGTLRIDATVCNPTRTLNQYEYQVQWFRGDGVMEKTNLSIWQRFSIPGQDYTNITAVAPNNTLVNFRLNVRRYVQK